MKIGFVIMAFVSQVVILNGSADQSKTHDGYTLVAPNFHTTTYLIDMDGNIVHYWENDGTPAISAYLLENGNLLRTSTVDQLQQQSPPGDQGAAGSPAFGFGGGMGFGAGMPGFGGLSQIESKGGGAGGRIQELDWDGNVVWEFIYSSDDHLMHHDIERMPNGNILCICWERKTAQEAIAAGRDPRMQGNSVLHPDYIIEVKPDKEKGGGEIVWQWHAWDHLIQDIDSSKANYGNVAAHPELIDINFTANRDITPAGGAQPTGMPGFGGMGGFGGPGGAMGGPRGGRGGPGGAMGGFGGFGGGAMPGLAGAGGTAPPDWMHTNAIDYNAELDQIAISCYGFSEIWVIDHSTTTEEAAEHTGGKCGKGGDLIFRWGNPRAYRAGTMEDQQFFNQHDVHWIPKGRPGEGHIMVFNNGPYRSDGDYSTVDEIVPPLNADGSYPLQKGKAFGPDKPVWTYRAPDKTEFFSMHISGAERLPNGNTLICSGAYGVIFEVSPDNEVLWRCAFTGADGPNGSDTKSIPGMMGGGGFGVPGGMGGFGGMPGFGGQQPAQAEELPHFVVSREDPAVAGTNGMPGHLPEWGGGTGFGVFEAQVFRVYRYTADYPGLKGKELKPIDID